MKLPGILRMEKGFYRNMAGLALPLVLQNLITESLALVDTFMVGALGESQLAGVTAANIPIFVIALFIFGVQSGCTVLISQYWGKGDTESIGRVLGMGFYTAGAVSTAFALLLFFASRPFLGLFCNDPVVAAYAAQYGRIVGFSYILNSVTQVYIGAHRSMGNPRLGLGILAVSMCANTFLNWVFIFGNLGAPRLGVEGAALGTLLARVLEFCVMLVYAVSNRRFRPKLRNVLRPGRAIAARFVRFATPVILNETLWGLGTSLYPTIMGHMAGSQEILAAYAVAGNVEKICTVAIFAVAATAAILVGQAVGAGERERAYKVGGAMDALASLLGLVIGGGAIVLLYTLAPRYLYPAVNLSPRAGDITTMMLTVTFATLSLRAFNSTNVVGVLRGGGDVTTASIIDLAFLWVVSLPLAALAGLVLKLDVLWVYLVLALEQSLKVIFGLHRYRSGKWIRDVTVSGGNGT